MNAKLHNYDDEVWGRNDPKGSQDEIQLSPDVTAYIVSRKAAPLAMTKKSKAPAFRHLHRVLFRTLCTAKEPPEYH